MELSVYQTLISTTYALSTISQHESHDFIKTRVIREEKLTETAFPVVVDMVRHPFSPCKDDCGTIYSDTELFI